MLHSMMPLPDMHKDAVLTMLMLAEDLAYLIVDSEFNIQFASPEAAGYGISSQDNLAQAPEWLCALRPRLTPLFDRPSLFTHSTRELDQHPVSIQAQVTPFDGVPRLLILLRRVGEASQLNLAPYHATTGLYSESFLENKLDEELARIKRFPAVFSLLAIEITPLPQPITPLGDLLRIHFRAVDIVGHAPHGGFLVLMPGTTVDQARLAGSRLATLAKDFHFILPATISVRYTAIEAVATDTRASLFARLNAAEPILAHS